MEEIEVNRDGILKAKVAKRTWSTQSSGARRSWSYHLERDGWCYCRPTSQLSSRCRLKKPKSQKTGKRPMSVQCTKEGNRNTPSNYRPVSLTSIIGKLWEHIITSQLMRYAESNNVLYEHQHGFRQKKSCEKQLELVRDISYKMDQGDEVHACMLDFSKAFGKVDHKKLVEKLTAHGVSYQVCSWVADFLSNRKQRVVLNWTKSEEAPVTSGVPQGSVLGPALFLFHINDLPANIKSNTTLFADDTIVYNSDGDQLRKDLLHLERWALDWSMEFNTIKSEHILFSRKRSPSTLKFMLGFVRWNLSVKSKKVKTAAYKSLVRPLVEYASASWDSLTATHKKKLENVQRRPARFTCNVPQMDRKTSTTGLLTDLGWKPLSSRRAERRLKIFAVYISDQKLPDYLLPSNRSNNKFIIPHCNIKHHQRSFFVRTEKD